MPCRTTTGRGAEAPRLATLETEHSFLGIGSCCRSRKLGARRLRATGDVRRRPSHGLHRRASTGFPLCIEEQSRIHASAATFRARQGAPIRSDPALGAPSLSSRTADDSSTARCTWAATALPAPKPAPASRSTSRVLPIQVGSRSASATQCRATSKHGIAGLIRPSILGPDGPRWPVWAKRCGMGRSKIDWGSARSDGGIRAARLIGSCRSVPAPGRGTRARWRVRSAETRAPGPLPEPRLVSSCWICRRDPKFSVRRPCAMTRCDTDHFAEPDHRPCR